MASTRTPPSERSRHGLECLGEGWRGRAGGGEQTRAGGEPWGLEGMAAAAVRADGHGGGDRVCVRARARIVLAKNLSSEAKPA